MEDVLFSINTPARTISNSCDFSAEESFKWLERRVLLRNECQAGASDRCLNGSFAIFASIVLRRSRSMDSL